MASLSTCHNYGPLAWMANLVKSLVNVETPGISGECARVTVDVTLFE